MDTDTIKTNFYWLFKIHVNLLALAQDTLGVIFLILKEHTIVAIGIFKFVKTSRLI